MSVNALWIVSVSTYVPLIMLTPSTIAIAVSSARVRRNAMLLSATRLIATAPP